MAICEAKGRDCIEESSSKTFNCNTTCVGIYADVQWVGENMEGELKDVNADEDIRDVLEGKMDDNLLKVLLLFNTEMTKHVQNEMKLIKNDMKHMKNDIDVMKIANGQRGDELDREKYEMLVSEYRKFKTTNVRHFSFNPNAKLNIFGETLVAQTLSRD